MDRLKERIDELNPLLLTHSKMEYIFYFLLIPAFLLLIYLLPSETKFEYFILSNYNFEFPNCILYSWTHLDFNHFSGNICSYLLVIFLIFNFEKRKARFWVISIFLFLFYFILEISMVLILSISYPNLLNLHSLLGFSGIISGFMGYLFVLFFYYLEENEGISSALMYIVLIMNLLIAIYNMKNGNFIAIVSEFLFLATFLFLICLSWYYRSAIICLFSKINELFIISEKRPFLNEIYWIILSLVMLVLFMLPFIFLLPSDFVSFTMNKNILAHYIGFFSGFFGFFVISKLLGKREECFNNSE